MSPDPSPNPRTGASRASRADYWVQQCVHRIATAAWKAGDRLPSVRQARSLWGVDTQTVQRVYATLEQRGLVDRRPRSGVYVREGSAVGRLQHHRYALERAFEDCLELVQESVDLSPLGVFRYFAHLAEQREEQAPTCAFLECTQTQADGHAQEVSERLGLPCLALQTGALASSDHLPPNLRALLVSAFHWHEVQQLQGVHNSQSAPPHLVRVAIELDPRPHTPPMPGRHVLIETEAGEGESLVQDLAELNISIELVLSSDTSGTLEDLRDQAGEVQAWLSPRVWGQASDHWRSQAWVHQLAYRIRDEAWPSIVDALALPLGDLQGP